MNRGFVVIWRKLQEATFYKDSCAFHLAIHLILKANHESRKLLFNGKALLIERGQCICGRDVLAQETGMNSSLVYRKLKILKEVGFLDIKSNNKYSLITICNYSAYQDIKDRNEQQNEQQANSKRTANEQQNDTNNNTTTKTIKTNNVFVPPTLQEVSDYCKERKSMIDVNKFIDFYESKGWMVGKNKMRDWKASVRTWEKGSSFNAKNVSNTPEVFNNNREERRRLYDELTTKVHV